MAENIIAELPPGEPTGHGGFRPPVRRPNPGELPPFEFGREAINELFRLRDRVHALESHILAGKLHFPPPGVHELPTHLEARRDFTAGELGWPDDPRPVSLGDLLTLLKQILQRLPPPKGNPGEIPP